MTSDSGPNSSHIPSWPMLLLGLALAGWESVLEQKRVSAREGHLTYCQGPVSALSELKLAPVIQIICVSRESVHSYLSSNSKAKLQCEKANMSLDICTMLFWHRVTFSFF